ncbi:MAG: shikimate kinase [Bacteroidales bacterium]|nr:shikimate kinase [Bacteroidales bacterium]
MIIALTGYMGSGKTTVGGIVADALGCQFMDLDDIIVKKAGKSIPDIFEQDGEEAFRALEADCLAKTVKKYANSTVVLALGGGTVTCPGASELLQKNTLCIWLKASPETLLARAAGTERPLADEHFARRYLAREPLYQAASHIVLDTDGLSSEEIADEIIIDCL